MRPTQSKKSCCLVLLLRLFNKLLLTIHKTGLYLIDMQNTIGSPVSKKRQKSCWHNHRTRSCYMSIIFGVANLRMPRGFWSSYIRVNRRTLVWSKVFCLLQRKPAIKRLLRNILKSFYRLKTAHKTVFFKFRLSLRSVLSRSLSINCRALGKGIRMSPEYCCLKRGWQ